MREAINPRQESIMFKNFDKQAFSLALVMTLSIVGGLGVLADSHYVQAHQWALAQAAESAAPAAQQVVITGHRVQQVVITGQRRG
jgi:hypothetical protein